MAGGIFTYELCERFPYVPHFILARGIAWLIQRHKPRSWAAGACADSLFLPVIVLFCYPQRTLGFVNPEYRGTPFYRRDRDEDHRLEGTQDHAALFTSAYPAAGAGWEVAQEGQTRQ